VRAAASDVPGSGYRETPARRECMRALAAMTPGHSSAIVEAEIRHQETAPLRRRS